MRRSHGNNHAGDINPHNLILPIALHLLDSQINVIISSFVEF